MATRTTSFPASGPRVPPLEPGDHLTRDEFERRYDATPALKKAELLEGVVHMPPPAVRWEYHARPHAILITWLGVYESRTPGVLVGDNGSIRLGTRDEPQPDATLMIDPKLGGQARHTADDYIDGAPELAAEVSASSASIDLNTKLRVYRGGGIREYLVWRILDETIEWFSLRGGDYVPLTTTGNVLRSDVFPGLWLDVPAMLRADLAGVLRTLEEGLKSAEHARFVAELATRAGGKQ